MARAPQACSSGRWSNQQGLAQSRTPFGDLSGERRCRKRLCTGRFADSGGPGSQHTVRLGQSLWFAPLYPEGIVRPIRYSTRCVHIVRLYVVPPSYAHDAFPFAPHCTERRPCHRATGMHQFLWRLSWRPLPHSAQSGRARANPYISIFLTYIIRPSNTPRFLRQRLRRAEDRRGLVEEAARSLNTLYASSVGPSQVPKPAAGTPNLAQQTVFRNLGRCAVRFLEEPAAQPPLEALYELLRTRDLYSEQESPRVPYDLAQLKVFRTTTQPRGLGQRLRGPAAELHTDYRRSIERSEGELSALLETGELVLPKPFWGEKLRTDRAVRRDFFARLCKRGLGGWRRVVSGHIGCFFVSKKSGGQRMIVDARCANREGAPSRRPAPGHAVGAVYVDNALAIAVGKAEANAALTEVCGAFTAVGLENHELVPATHCLEFVGLALDLSRLELRNTSRHAWRLRSVTEALLEIGGAIARMMEVYVGHVVHCFMLRPRALARLCRAYDFMRLAMGFRRLGADLVEELKAIKGLILTASVVRLDAPYLKGALCGVEEGVLAGILGRHPGGGDGGLPPS